MLRERPAVKPISDKITAYFPALRPEPPMAGVLPAIDFPVRVNESFVQRPTFERIAVRAQAATRMTTLPVLWLVST